MIALGGCSLQLPIAIRTIQMAFRTGSPPAFAADERFGPSVLEDLLKFTDVLTELQDTFALIPGLLLRSLSSNQETHRGPKSR